MKLVKTLLLTGIAAAGCFGVSAPAQAQSPLIGQLSAFGTTFCPRGWTGAEGQLLPINQYTALFSIYGTTYGGDGRTTFGLPDLRGRRPISLGTGPGLPNYSLGEKGGAESFTLQTINMPSHSHVGMLGASPTVADTNQPVRNSIAIAPPTMHFRDGAPAINNMHPGTLRINPAGSGQQIGKLSPYQVVRWCVALVGVFPPRN